MRWERTPTRGGFVFPVAKALSLRATLALGDRPSLIVFINPSTCFAMKNTWKHGTSQVRLYDPYAPGDVSRYLSKGRFSSAADCEGANTCELRKFDRADWIYVSPGAWAEMREARTVAIRTSPLSS